MLRAEKTGKFRQPEKLLGISKSLCMTFSVLYLIRCPLSRFSGVTIFHEIWSKKSGFKMNHLVGM